MLRDFIAGRRKLRTARRELARVGERDYRAGYRNETPWFLAASRAVREARQALPWWAR